MRTFIIVLMILTSTPISCCAQKLIEVECYKIPEIVTGKHLKVEIKDKNVWDSLKVAFAVLINFKYPLQDTTKAIEIESIEISWLTVVSLKTNEKIFNHFSDDKKMSAYQKYIWNLCNDKFQYWYKNKPYETMSDRSMQEERAVFGGVFYIVPERPGLIDILTFPKQIPPQNQTKRGKYIDNQ